MSNKHQPTGTKTTEVLPPEILVHQQQESNNEVPDADDRIDFIEFFNEVDASLGQSPPNTLKIETSNHLPSSTLSKHSRLPKPPKAPPPPPPRTNGIFLASGKYGVLKTLQNEFFGISKHLSSNFGRHSKTRKTES